MAIGTDSPIHVSQTLFSFEEPASILSSPQRNSRKSKSATFKEKETPLLMNMNPKDGLKRSRKYKSRFLEIFKDFDIHPLDMEPGYQFPRKSVSFELLNDLDSLSSYQVHESPTENTHSQKKGTLIPHDRALRKDVVRMNYGEFIIKQIQEKIVHHLSRNESRVLSFDLQDSLLRCILHACCRYYGLESYSMDDSTGRRITFVSLDTTYSISLEQKMGFCEYFYKTV